MVTFDLCRCLSFDLLNWSAFALQTRSGPLAALVQSSSGIDAERLRSLEEDARMATV